MSTNFYLSGHPPGTDSPEWHVGKRSAGGLYCWDCQATLCLDGPDAIHLDRSRWSKTCPRCGKGQNKHADVDALTRGPVARELGFDKSPFASRKGVDGCSTFRWAMDPERVLRGDFPTSCHACGQPVPAGASPIVDEYGRGLSLDEFKAMLRECPIQYHDMIGEVFA